ncbi:hypothetical protein GA0070618_0173 [Micromonospora echinospora]|uniref:Uncharacterized protein n=1 Tax=Micromonospora echinospora TaxID=1877 RepID=A0A1C4UB76_MICEC|nr:hypothetical protein GA0070618_0173 [Micromonospora echinospora]
MEVVTGRWLSRPDAPVDRPAWTDPRRSPDLLRFRVLIHVLG